MTRLTIDTGVLGNPATGDTLRTAMGKINSNFIELYDDVAASGLGGQLTNPTTNGDIKIQPNGTGIVEIDQLQITDDAITSMITNGDVTLTGNGVGGVKIESILINGTSISSEDSTTININDGLIIDGDLTVTGSSGITFSDNTITSSSSNANLELSAAGTGEVTTDANFKLISETPFLKIQRTDNANVPGIDFVGQAGTSGAKILFDGTSGTANELIFQTFTVAGGLAEAFRVQQGGAKVTGSLDIDAGITIADNTITTSASNANLELTASGTGTVKVLGILSVDDGSVSDNYVGVGNDDDLKIYHDSSFDNSVIDNLTGHLVIRNNTSNTTKNVYIQSDNDVLITSIGDEETFAKFSDDAGVELYFDNVKKFETTSTGATVTGIFNIGDGSVSDNYIGLGAANDLKIFHNGSHSIIRETGTGSLYIQSDTNVIIGKDSSSETMIKGVADGAVELYHDNTKKFETTSGGVSVTGNLAADGSQIDFTSLPTSDPGVAGRLFRSGNDVKISTG